MSNIALTAEQITAVKGDGFLLNRGTSQFSGRIITKNGILTANQMAVLAEASRKYGNGSLAFTVRLTVEVPGIEYENIGPFKALIATANMQTGGTGPKVRPIVACKGTTCVFGLYDTQQLAAEIHERFYEGYRNVTLPHKFKIAVGGCPNNCVKPDLNDLGIVGQRTTKIDYNACRGCKKCRVIEVCPMHAVELRNGKINIDRSICNSCGRCVGKCPFKVTNNFEDRYKVYVGGKWGKAIRMGSMLDTLFTKEEVLQVIEKSILLFKSKGIPKERFGQTCDRLGMDKVNKILASDNLLKKKEEIFLHDCKNNYLHSQI